MITKLNNIKLSTISCAVPKNIKSVAEYCNGLVTEKEAKRLARNTGFEMLRITEAGMTTSDLCVQAAEHIFEMCNIEKKEIDGLVFVSQTPDYILPSTSHILQSRLGLSENLFAIDINQGCSGYVYGLNVAGQLVSSGQCRKVLLCAGDTISKLTNKNDRATRTIFGDAGTATIVEKGTKEIIFNFNTFGKKYESIIVKNSRHRKSQANEEYNNYLFLDGMEIMNFTLADVPRNIEELLKTKNFDKKDVDLFALHQANKLILNSLSDSLKINNEKIPFLANKIGNTSSASIPLLLTEIDKNAYNLENVILCGFGVGLSIASAFVDLSDTKILEMVSI